METVKEFFETPNNYLNRSYGVKVRSRIVRNILGSVNSLKILDVGSGDGTLTKDYILENEVSWIELSENMIREAVSKLSEAEAESVKVYNTSIDSFITEESYDVILVIGLLAHIKNWKQLLNKLNVILKPGGTMIIQVSDQIHPLTIWNRRKSRNRKYKLKKIGVNELDSFIRSELKLKLSSRFRYSLFFPGFGLLPDDFLERYTWLTFTNPLLSKMSSELILTYNKDRI